MRLLILTQKVDSTDNVLGFFHAWIRECAKHCEKIIVICLEKGTHNLPSNVEVLSLGKEQYKTQNTRYKIQKQIFFALKFYKYIWKLRTEYDGVFVHMNPEYVMLGGILWRLLKKRIVLWYVHRQVNMKLRIAEAFSHSIFSTTPEAFRLKSKKVNFVGHGIDFSLFSREVRGGTSWSTSEVDQMTILHLGRITPIKNLDILIEAGKILKEKWRRPFSVKLVGAPSLPGDFEYEKKLKNLVAEHHLENEISFEGAIPFTQTPELYRNADISVNLTPTGGMDKAVLESIACGTIPLSANKAFKDLFGRYADTLLYNERDAKDTAEKILNIMRMNSAERREIEEYLYKRVHERFDLGRLIERIVRDLKTA